MYDFFHKAFVKWNMSEVAKIEGRVRYSAFKKTIKVMITSTDSLDDLKAQLNTYFEHLDENQYTRHLFGQMSCIDLGEDREEYAWKMASYVPWLIEDDSDVGLYFGIWWKIIYYICMFVPYAIALNVLFNLMICNEL